MLQIIIINDIWDTTKQAGTEEMKACAFSFVLPSFNCFQIRLFWPVLLKFFNCVCSPTNFATDKTDNIYIVFLILQVLLLFWHISIHRSQETGKEVTLLLSVWQSSSATENRKKLLLLVHSLRKNLIKNHRSACYCLKSKILLWNCKVCAFLIRTQLVRTLT